MLNAKIALLIFLGLFVGVWSLAYSQPPPPGPAKAIQKPQDQTKNNHQVAKDDKRGTENSPLVIKIKDTPESKINAEQTAKYQEEETASSWWLVRITGILAFIAAAEAGVLIWQTSELRNSIKVAQKAANAAQKSAEALPLIERAYVFVTIPYHVIIPVKEDPELLECKVTVAFFNHGKTPAILKQLKVNMRVIPINEELGELIGDTESEIPEGVIIGSREEYKADYSTILRKEQWEDIENIHSTLFCYGRIIYEDVLKNRRTTGYCWDYHPVFLKCFYISNNKKLNYYT